MRSNARGTTSDRLSSSGIFDGLRTAAMTFSPSERTLSASSRPKPVWRQRSAKRGEMLQTFLVIVLVVVLVEFWSL